MKKRSQTIIFCAQQRSGTTVLQRAFQETGIFKNYSEIFHHSPINNPNNHFSFFNFKRHLISKEIKYFFPARENQKHIFDLFFDKLENETSLPYNIVDIKYNSWHHLNPVWHSAQEIPTLLMWAQLRKIPILHIVRKNLLHQFISHEIANSTGKWHYKKGESRNKEKVSYNINPTDCLMGMRIVKRDIRNFRSWLSSYPLSYEIEYEELIVDNKFTSKVNHIVSEITNGRVDKLGDPPLKKGISNPIQLIENKDELFSKIKNTQFSHHMKS